jgi:hypothetical protein
VPLINEQEKKFAGKKKIIDGKIIPDKDFPNYIIVKTQANLDSEDPS